MEGGGVEVLVDGPVEVELGMDALKKMKSKRKRQRNKTDRQTNKQRDTQTYVQTSKRVSVLVCIIIGTWLCSLLMLHSKQQQKINASGELILFTLNHFCNFTSCQLYDSLSRNSDPN